ncbi:phosphate/phosphite/phosphonate ABC transporter substrate-binding protein [Alkalisalibacterium limincola]|nr:PhnD/SsuA/transferrin family substrate-binding protein [Alkalisalibacterium limincola]
MKHRFGPLILALATALAASASAQAADFRVTVEPSFPRGQAAEVYQPLLDYLGQATGHRFELHVPSNYHALWREIRIDSAVDFAFEEAHFTDYRAKRTGFTPLVRTIEPTRFSLIAMPHVADEGANGLIGHRVVSMPAPSLGSAVLGEVYPNPIAQPEIESSAASWRDGVEMVFADEAEAAMVPNYIADLYPNLLPISESRAFPGRAFSAAPMVPEDVRAAVREALLALDQQDELYTLLAELGISGFVDAEPGEYDGNDEMLRGFFGFKAAPVAYDAGN